MTRTVRVLSAAILGTLAIGCGGDSGQRPPPATPASLPQFQPGSLVVALTVDGPHADLGKSARCTEILERNGVIVQPQAQIMAQLTLFEGRHMLRIFRRLSIADFQLLRQSPKPDWSMGELCTDMVREIVAALQGPPAQGPPVGAAGSPSGGVAGSPSGGPAGPPPGLPPTEAPPPRMTTAPPAASPDLQLLPPSSALPANVQALVGSAEAAYRAGDFSRAHAAYAEAHRQSGDANLLFDLGLCYVRLGRNAEGLKFLQLYLDRAPNAPNRPATEQKLIELRRALGDDD